MADFYPKYGSKMLKNARFKNQNKTLEITNGGHDAFYRVLRIKKITVFSRFPAAEVTSRVSCQASDNDSRRKSRSFGYFILKKGK